MTGREKYFSKVIITHGVGLETPNEGSLCKVNMRVTQGEVNVLHDEENVMWKLGQDSGYVSEIINDCLEDMHSGEVCKITLHLCEELQEHLKLFITSENLPVEYQIKLISFEKAKESWELTFPERLQFANDEKDKGSRYYKARLWLFAARHYSKAIKSLVMAKLQQEDNSTEAFSLLQVQCYSNLAACQLKLDRYKDAIENCTKALNLDSTNVKVLYRRSQAFTTINEFEKADTDIAEALKLDPDNKDLLQLKLLLHDKIHKYNATTAEAMKKMFQP